MDMCPKSSFWTRTHSAFENATEFLPVDALKFTTDFAICSVFTTVPFKNLMGLRALSEYF